MPAIGLRSALLLSAAAPAVIWGMAEARAAETAFEEILVTAQRRTESVQDLPLAIQAVSGDTLSAKGVVEFSQLAAVSPSFSFTEVGATPIVGLRGASSELAQIAGEASVSTSVDGVPLLRQKYLGSAFFDVERVEILRGPQGTISGRNATGGAINLISKRPSQEFEGGVELGYGNYDSFNSRLYVSGPITNTIAMRLAAESRDQDGFVKSSLTGLRFGGKEERLGRLSVLATPNENVELLLSGDYYKNDDARTASVSGGLYDPALQGFVPPTVALAPPPAPPIPNGGALDGTGFGTNPYYDPESRLAQIGSTNENADIEVYGFTLNASIELSDNATLRSVTGYRHLDSVDEYDSVRGPTVIDPIVEATRQEQFSQELTLTSSFGDSFDWLVGGQYIDESAKQQTDVIYLQGLAIGTDLSVYDTMKLQSYAIFGQIGWHFAPDWRLTLGGRYTHDEKKYIGDASIPNNTPPLPFLNQTGKNSWGAFTPRIALDFQPTDDLTMYASVSKGFKGGGFGSAGALGGVQPFRPETVWNYEAGLKSRWLDRRLGLDLTGFWADYKDLQYPLYVAPATIVRNAGKARIRGIEFDLTWQATESFDFGFNTTYLDAEYREFCVADPGQPIAPLTCTDSTTGFSGLDLAGNRISRAPKWSFNTNATYRVELGDSGSITLRADFNYQTKVYFSAFNVDTVSQGKYGILNLRATYRTADERIEISGFVRNVTDKDYYVGKVALGSALAGFDPRAGGALVPVSTVNAVVGEPRMYGVSVGYKF